MGFSLDLKNNSKQQERSRLGRETDLASQAKQGRKPDDKLKAKSSISQPHGNLARERRRHTNDGILLQPESSRSRQQHSDKSDKDDELVKYMSNLPAYLQRMERGPNVQGMALNVGVLDWARLEKWKSKQKDVTARDGNEASFTNYNLSSKIRSSSTSFNTAQNERPVYQGKQHPSLRSSVVNSSRADHSSLGAKPSYQNATHRQDLETVSNTKNNVDLQKTVPWTYKSSGGNESDAVPEKENRRYLDQRIGTKVGDSSSSSRYNRKSIMKTKVLDQTTTSSIKASSSEMKVHDVSFSSKEQKNVSKSEPTMGTKKLQESAIDLSPQHQTGDSKNIVLLLPRKYLSNCSLEEPRTSVGENFTAADHNVLTDSCSYENLHSSELRSEIPHSCPLPSTDETSTDPCLTAHIVGNTGGVELSSESSYKSPCLHRMPSIPPASEHGENSIKFEPGNIVKSSKTMEQDVSTPNSGKGRDPSPNRRFSFSLGRMTRSFSFKDSSAIPQLNSTYISTRSGPIISKAASYSDNSNSEKASGHNRARSSPLRRILDPLLKSKGTQSAETAPPLKGSLKPSINAIESLEKEKHEISRIQALLQLTVRNGLPLLRFVVDNSSIIAVPMKTLTSETKTSSGCNYTFYAIDEIKKKSGRWINQGSKEKSCGYVYNVIGQMKVRGSSFFDMSAQYPVNQYTVNESVLFGVKLTQADQESQKFMPSGELAAVVVKTPSKNLNLDAELRDKDEDLMKNDCSLYFLENECSSNLRENLRSNIVTAVLPGAIHGLPNEGVPSSLIHRWKTGGSCDCGGWDVGCKLRILSNEMCKVPRTSKSCLTSDCYELFDQEGAQQDKPIFSLTPLEKGIYAVEFSSSISSLQAFFICVSLMNSKESSDFVERTNMSEEKILPKSKNANDGTTMAQSFLQGRAPVKYTPSPPLSPVGRV